MRSQIALGQRSKNISRLTGRSGSNRHQNGKNLKAVIARPIHKRPMDARNLEYFDTDETWGEAMMQAPRIERKLVHSSELTSVEDFSVRDDPHAIRGYTPEFQLALPYRGVFSWDIGLGRTMVDPNRTMFIAGDRSFTERQPIPEIGHSSMILTPRREALDELLALARRNHRVIDTDVALPISTSLRIFVQHWLAATRAENPDGLALDELTVATFREAMRVSPCRNAFPSPLIARAKELMHERMSDSLSLTRLARMLGVSPAYLTQTFSRAEGMPLYRYQLHLRLARAMVELPVTDDITGLALELGFSSHSHFTTAFKAFAKQTPSAFREAFRKRSYPAIAGHHPSRCRALPKSRFRLRPANDRSYGSPPAA